MARKTMNIKIIIGLAGISCLLLSGCGEKEASDTFTTDAVVNANTADTSYTVEDGIKDEYGPDGTYYEEFKDVYTPIGALDAGLVEYSKAYKNDDFNLYAYKFLETKTDDQVNTTRAYAAVVMSSTNFKTMDIDNDDFHGVALHDDNRVILIQAVDNMEDIEVFDPSLLVTLSGFTSDALDNANSSNGQEVADVLNGFLEDNNLDGAARYEDGKITVYMWNDATEKTSAIVRGADQVADGVKGVAENLNYKGSIMVEVYNISAGKTLYQTTVSID